MTGFTNTSRYGLVADIGGTNVRFALVEVKPQTPIVLLETRLLACVDYPGPVAAIRHYYEMVGIDPAQVDNATIAVAGPIKGDWFEMTNNPWAFLLSAVQQQLGMERFAAINDFTAVAWVVSCLSEDDYVAIGGGAPQSGAAIGIVGPGTGLGVGGLFRHRGAVIPLESEGGHVAFAPANKLEIEILNILQDKYERVSSERLLSGPGLVELHEALARIEGRTVTAWTAAEITDAAVAGTDAHCVSVLNHFCAILGGFAGDLALTLGAKGGIYIGGGIVPRFAEFLERSPFRECFEAKGRFNAYNAAIPTRVLTLAQPGLLGAAAHLLACNQD
jgi:glucokinase